MTVLYTDLSHHDWSRHGGEPDWRRILAATSPAICLRATYGDPAGFNPASPHFRESAVNARRAGFTLIGGYHNLIRGDSAGIARQVDYFRRELDAAGCDWAMLDVERYPELLTRDLHPRIGDVARFYDRWRQVDRRPLALYLPRWIWDGHMSRPDLAGFGAPLVASDYSSNPDGSPTAVYAARGGDTGRGWTAYGGVTPAVWQYGSNVDCPGASGQTDCNAFRGSLAELRALLTAPAREGDDDMLTDADMPIIRAALHSTEIGRTGVTFAQALDQARHAQDEAYAARQDIYTLRGEVAALAAQVAAPQPVQVDPATLSAALISPEFLAAVARAVNDDQAARLAG